MSIIKWEPFSGIDRFFDEFPSLSIRNIGFDLAVDLYEENDEIIAKMNLPGVDPSKINISIENNSLRISGLHEEEKEKKDKHYYSKEIRQGSFERRIPLPCVVEEDKVSAEYEKGVLKVKLPKSKEAIASKKIEVVVKK